LRASDYTVEILQNFSWEKIFVLDSLDPDDLNDEEKN